MAQKPRPSQHLDQADLVILYQSFVKVKNANLYS